MGVRREFLKLSSQVSMNSLTAFFAFLYSKVNKLLVISTWIHCLLTNETSRRLLKDRSRKLDVVEVVLMASCQFLRINLGQTKWFTLACGNHSDLTAASLKLSSLTGKKLDGMGIAREAFIYVPGLWVMIRPKAGDFCYSTSDLAQIHDSMYRAAGHGANDIVLRVLDSQHRLDLEALSPLSALAHYLLLQVTFHRAFDVIEDLFDALEQLIDLGVSKVICFGTAWESGGSVIEGFPRLLALLTQAVDRIELVIGGGVCPDNVAHILNELDISATHWSLHGYSTLLYSDLSGSRGAKPGRVSQAKVAELVDRNQTHTSLQVPLGQTFIC
ncbi:copper homeostasis protein CutC [Shewanella indica]|uniref:copper homeostasis protein CutC n=1 Tax=Shewanella indica TaxID=768528 RepID=UPI00313AA6DF